VWIEREADLPLLSPLSDKINGTRNELVPLGKLMKVSDLVFVISDGAGLEPGTHAQVVTLDQAHG